MSIRVQSSQYLPEFRYPNGLTWRVEPGGTLNIRDEKGAIIATHAAHSWDAVKLVEDQGSGTAGPIDPPRPANHHPRA